MVALGLAALACSSGRDRGVPAPGASQGEVTSEPTAGGGHSEPGEPVSETEARTLLAERFRAAGYRVRYDVRITGQGFDITVDGYDPDARVGFEYIAPAERDTDVMADEREHLVRDGAHRVLILDPLPRSALEQRIDAFLAEARP